MKKLAVLALSVLALGCGRSASKSSLAQNDPGLDQLLYFYDTGDTPLDRDYVRTAFGPVSGVSVEGLLNERSDVYVGRGMLFVKQDPVLGFIRKVDYIVDGINQPEITDDDVQADFDQFSGMFTTIAPNQVERAWEQREETVNPQYHIPETQTFIREAILPNNKSVLIAKKICRDLRGCDRWVADELMFAYYLQPSGL